MARKRLIWKVLPVYGTVIAVCTLAIAYYAGSSVSSFVRQTTERSLKDLASTLQDQAAPMLAAGDVERMQQLADTFSERTDDRITLIAADGIVLAESHADPAQMDNHADRPEIAQALAGKFGRSARHSKTLNKTIYYAAQPLYHDGQIIGVVRVSISEAQVRSSVNQVIRRVMGGGLLAALIIGLLTVWVYRRHISGPMVDLQQGARRFAEGDLSQPLRVPDSEEIGGLAEALNRMASQLDTQIHTIREQATEREAVLAGMAEGVLAIDLDQQVISMNAMASRLLGTPETVAIGKAVAEVVRNAELLRLVNRALKSDRPVEGEFILQQRQGERTLAAKAAILRDTERRRIGAVLVLNDVTRLRQLEMVRQQFVANVSHELKTPITAIKAAVETVMGDPEETTTNGDAEKEVTRNGHETDPAAVRRFLPIIDRQADRLNAIVEDLLTLARLEHDPDQSPMPLEPLRIVPILRGAAETCQPKATARDIAVSIEARPDLEVPANDTLLGQAVVNLLDNAIKYSPPGRSVYVYATTEEDEVVITVKDEGIGIEADHLPRLFERFYRTDKARSREMGGTGLGLAIVKHVAQIHNGRVSVDSKPGQGATFRLHLPGRVG